MYSNFGHGMIVVEFDNQVKMMAKFLFSFQCVLLLFIAHGAGPQSLFDHGPITTLRTKACINMGTAEETIGHYEAESQSQFNRFSCTSGRNIPL